MFARSNQIIESLESSLQRVDSNPGQPNKSNARSINRASQAVLPTERVNSLPLLSISTFKVACQRLTAKEAGDIFFLRLRAAACSTLRRFG